MSATRKLRATADEFPSMIRMRLEHASWEEIARRHGYADGASARRSVVRFARATGDELLVQALRGRRARPRRGWDNGDGYIRLALPDHPLADRRGHVLEHRAVLYAALGPGPHACSQCGEMVDWPEITVDHINRTRTDNSRANLRGCCNPCNSHLRWRPGCGYPEWMYDPDCPDDFEGWEAA